MTKKNISLTVMATTVAATIGIISLSLLGNKLSNNDSVLVNSYVFSTYNTSSSSSLVGNDGSKVATDSNGDVVYGTKASGLSIGITSNNSYNFSNYTTSNGLKGNSIGALAFSSSGAQLAIGENDSNGDAAGLQIFSGDLTSKPTIKTYDSSSNANFLSGPVTGVSFYNTNKVNLLFVTFGKNPSNNSEGGLSVGILGSNNIYTFSKYTESNNGNFKGNFATSLAVTSQDTGEGTIVAVGTKASGFNLGISNSSGGYNFTNYSSAKFPAFNTAVSNLAFSNTQCLAISLNRAKGSHETGLVYGTPGADQQYAAFKSYPTSGDSGIGSNSGTGVALSYQSHIAYSSNDNGLYIGDQNGKGNMVFQNYNAANKNNENVASDVGTSIAFQLNTNTVFYTSNHGLDVGKISGEPNVGFNLSDLNYNLSGNNSYSVSNLKFTAVFKNNVIPDGDYVQMLVYNAASPNIAAGIYLSGDGKTPSEAPTTNIKPIDMKLNTNSNNFNYTVPSEAISSLSSNTTYGIIVTYGDHANYRENIASSSFTTPKTVTNKFNSNTIKYDTNDNNYLTISSLAFNFSSSLANVVSDPNYIVITISNSSSVVAALYLTPNGTLPDNYNSSIPDILKTQAISDASAYNAINLTYKFATSTKYTIQYSVGNKNNNDLSPLSASSSFTTPAIKTSDSGFIPSIGGNSDKAMTSKIVGSVIGGVGATSALVATVFFTYKLSRRKFRSFK